MTMDFGDGLTWRKATASGSDNGGLPLRHPRPSDRDDRHPGLEEPDRPRPVVHPTRGGRVPGRRQGRRVRPPARLSRNATRAIQRRAGPTPRPARRRCLIRRPSAYRDALHTAAGLVTYQTRAVSNTSSPDAVVDELLAAVTGRLPR